MRILRIVISGLHWLETSFLGGSNEFVGWLKYNWL